ncbi:MAG TPA: TPM domain-containing protein, partial [Myxococcota bacterium]|nr:TPM domain-containing protein [Myxococcota bacterium]
MRRIATALVSLAALACLGVALRGHWPGRQSLAQVSDGAALLFPFGAIVERQCAQTRDDLGVDVRVETLRAGAEPIAQLAERRFRELGVGGAAPTGGILILLDEEGAQARIEVSYSLEGLLPDAIVSRIARDQLVPYASHDAAGVAVMDVVHFLRDRLLDGVASGEL